MSVAGPLRPAGEAQQALQTRAILESEADGCLSRVTNLLEAATPQQSASRKVPCVRCLLLNGRCEITDAAHSSPKRTSAPSKAPLPAVVIRAGQAPARCWFTSGADSCDPAPNKRSPITHRDYRGPGVQIPTTRAHTVQRVARQHTCSYRLAVHPCSGLGVGHAGPGSVPGHSVRGVRAPREENCPDRIGRHTDLGSHAGLDERGPTTPAAGG